MSSPSPLYTTPNNVVIGFYSLLNDKKYDEAFECLTPDYQARGWENDRANFAKGYLNTVRIDNVQCHLVQENPHTAHCHVSYKDTINALHHPLMDFLVGNTKTRPAEMKAIQDFNTLMIDTLNASPEKIAEIPLEYYFSKNNVEMCLWKAGADYSRNKELFTRSRETLDVFRNAVCVRQQESWRIDALKR